ncbi:MAG TPA: DUF4476 domain-containing protein [Flavobacteriales bacterium]
MPTLQAQTADIVVFSEMGEKFTLVIDGDEKNSTPATRVVATGIKNPTPLVLVRFADTAIPPLKQNGWMEAGQEYTIRITTNKKGERVFRMQGTAPLGTASGAPSEKVKPTEFVEDGAGVVPVQEESEVTMEPGGVQTTTVVTETSGSTDGNVNINMNVPGFQFNMGVSDPNAQRTTSTTTTTTTTTSSYSSSSSNSDGGRVRPVRPVREPEPEVYRMPGYSGAVGCPQAPMGDAEFSAIKANITDKNFEDTKVSTAKTIAGGRCFSSAQVRELLTLFNFEDSKLDFAKFAYDRTHDIGNYFKVNDVFNFDSSVEDLNQYIRSR